MGKLIDIIAKAVFYSSLPTPLVGVCVCLSGYAVVPGGIVAVVGFMVVASVAPRAMK